MKTPNRDWWRAASLTRWQISTRGLVVMVALLIVALAAAIFVEMASSGVRSLPMNGRAAADQTLGNGQVRFFPRSSRVSIGVPYRLQLYAHCGIGWPGTVDFDGSLWDSIGSGQASDGNDDKQGIMTLISPTLSLYRVSGIVVQFSRHAGPQTGVPCK